MNRRSLAVIFALLAASGCSAINNYDLNGSPAKDAEREGVQYSLPVALFQVVLYVEEASATFWVTLSPPNYFNDPQHRYLLQYKPHVNYDDTIDFEVNKSGFLTLISADTTDHTGDILVEVARTISSFNQLQAAGVSNSALLLYQVALDPVNTGHLKRVNGSLNAKAQDFASREDQRCKTDTTYATNHAQACSEYHRIAINGPGIVLKVHQPAPVAGVKPVDCTKIVCYRAAQAHGISIKFGDRGTAQTMVDIPNSSPLVGIDVQRAFLGKKLTEIAFDDTTGLLKSVHVKKSSETYEAVQLPLKIASAVFDTSLIQFKMKYNSAQEQYTVPSLTPPAATPSQKGGWSAFGDAILSVTNSPVKLAVTNAGGGGAGGAPGVMPPPAPGAGSH